MYCKLIKLTNGDDIIGMIDDDCSDLEDKKYIEVFNPVALHTMRMPFPKGVVETFYMRPWIKIVSDEAIKIPVRNIITTGNVIAVAEEQYTDFISNGSYTVQDGNALHDYHDNDEGDEDPLEQFFNALDSDEEEDDGRIEDTRTLH